MGVVWILSILLLLWMLFTSSLKKDEKNPYQWHPERVCQSPLTLELTHLVSLKLLVGCLWPQQMKRWVITTRSNCPKTLTASNCTCDSLLLRFHQPFYQVFQEVKTRDIHIKNRKRSSENNSAISEPGGWTWRLPSRKLLIHCHRWQSLCQRWLLFFILVLAGFNFSCSPNESVFFVFFYFHKAKQDIHW